MTEADEHLMIEAVREIGAQRDSLFRQNERMCSALRHCEDYFDNRADVKDGSYGVPEPNTEMSCFRKYAKLLACVNCGYAGNRRDGCLPKTLRRQPTLGLPT